MPNAPEPRRLSIEPGGPVLVEGPVEIVREDGSTVTSDRFVVAVCTCRRSRMYPWCDTSHRRHRRPVSPPSGEGGPEAPGGRC